jgi:hypothetical protein
MMKVSNRGAMRFDHVKVLTDASPFLGTTVSAWNDALTGNLAQSLARVKLLVDADGPKRDVSEATSFDLASAAGKLLASKA